MAKYRERMSSVKEANRPNVKLSYIRR